MQKAILASDVDGEQSDQAERKEEPPIPISELSPESKAADPHRVQQHQAPISITELPPESKPAISPQEQEKRQSPPAEDHKRQTAG